MRSRIRTDNLTVTSDPFVRRDNLSHLGTRADLQELVVDDVAGPAAAFAPEILPVHLAVRKPQALMMHMVLRFILVYILHRPMPSDRRAGRPNHRIKEGTCHISIVVLCERLAV